MRRRRTTLLVVGGLLVLVVLVPLSLMIGAGSTPPTAVWDVLRGHADVTTRALVLDYRWPRTLVAIAVGIALGVAGMLMQAFTRNPLADPGILGVNAGASLAVVVSISVFGLGSISDFIWPALAGALAATVLVVLIGSAGHGPATPLRLTLAGVALAAVLGGVANVIRLTDPDTFNRMRTWAAGSVAGRSLDDLTTLLPWLVGGVLAAAVVARPLNALAMGDDLATALGATVARTRIISILAVTVLAGAATAIAGPIGFIGLMVPHVCRWAVGPDQRRILAATLVAAPVLLLLSDLVSRVVLGQRELPVGVVTAFIGAPVLIALVRRRKVSAL